MLDRVFNEFFISRQMAQGASVFGNGAACEKGASGGLPPELVWRRCAVMHTSNAAGEAPPYPLPPLNHRASE